MPIAVTTTVGAPVEVTLERYATAGYRWEVAGKPDAVTVSDAGTAAAGSANPGAPAQQSFRLSAAAPGVYVIELASRRPWESAADRTEAVTLTVTPP
jgi:predicted secreted protein